MKLRNVLLTAAASAIALSLVSIPIVSNARPGGAGSSWVAGPQSSGFGLGEPGPSSRRGPGSHGPGAQLFRMMTPFWQRDAIAEKLQLTEEQLAGLEESHAVAREELQATRGSVRDAMEAVKEELEKDNPDLDTVYELQEAVNAELDGKAKTILGHVVTVKTILTAEQEETLRELRDQVRPRGPRGPGAFGGPGVPGSDSGNIQNEIRELIQNGATYEEVEEYLATAEVPEGMVDRILSRVERHLERIEAGEEVGPRQRPGQERPQFGQGRGRR